MKLLVALLKKIQRVPTQRKNHLLANALLTSFHDLWLMLTLLPYISF